MTPMSCSNADLLIFNTGFLSAGHEYVLKTVPKSLW